MEIICDDHRWVVRFGGNRYDLAFADGALRNTYFGPDFDGHVVTVPDHHQNFDHLRETRPEAAVFVGPNRDRVFWDRIVTQQRPDGLGITLVGARLQADLDFIFDDPTGSLRRTTTLRSSSPEAVDVRGSPSRCSSDSPFAA